MTSNVLLIVLDAVRAGKCSIYNTSQETTPFLQTFSNEYTTYSQARSGGNNTPSSHASMFTGLQAEQHNIRGVDDTLDTGHSVWEWLNREWGYNTGIFSYNGFLNNDVHGLTNGFDFVNNHRLLRRFPDGLHPGDIAYRDESLRRYVDYFRACLNHERPLKSILNGVHVTLDRDTPAHSKGIGVAETLTKQFLTWLDGRSDAWGACINFMDAHYPYQPMPDFDDRALLELQNQFSNLAFDCYCDGFSWSELRELEKLYNSGIRRIDASISTIVTELKARGEFEDTLVIITADHGEGFGERSRLEPDLKIAEHEWGIHEVLFHVPLLVKRPGQSESRRYDSLASLTQFPDVLRDVITDEACPADFCQDEVLVSSQTPRGSAQLDLALRYCEDIDFLHRHKRAVYKQEDDTIVKYMTSKDDQECHEAAASIRIDGRDVRSVNRDAESIVSDRFSSIEDKSVKSTIESVPQETLQRLEDLGYV